jgi:hypothetical protein
VRYIAAFGAFWYDFIVGDSVVLAIGGVAVLAVGALLVHSGMRAAAEVALPAIVVATLAISLRD